MRITNRTRIEAAPEAVWTHIGPGFTSIGTWASEVPHSRAAAPSDDRGLEARQCGVRTAGFTDITEALTDYDEHARTLTYEVADGPRPAAQHAVVTWSVGELDDGSAELAVDATITLRPWARPLSPLLAPGFQRIWQVTAEDLRALLTTGRPSARKRAVASGAVARLARWVGVNSAVSGASGLAAIIAAPWLAHHLGGAPVGLFRWGGAALALYAGWLALLAVSGPSARDGRVVAALDGAWVIGTAAVLAAVGGSFTPLGTVLLVGIADVVAVLGLLQWRAAPRVGEAGAALDGSAPGAVLPLPAPGRR